MPEIDGVLRIPLLIVVHMRWVWNETWWSWNRPATEPLFWYDIACHYFNLVEAIAWFTLAALIARRWHRNRRSPLELLYAGSFVTFGLSDVIEAWFVTSWLLWWKLANLIVLLKLRQQSLSRWHPENRVY